MTTGFQRTQTRMHVQERASFTTEKWFFNKTTLIHIQPKSIEYS